MHLTQTALVVQVACRYWHLGDEQILQAIALHYALGGR